MPGFHQCPSVLKVPLYQVRGDGQDSQLHTFVLREFAEGMFRSSTLDFSPPATPKIKKAFPLPYSMAEALFFILCD